MSASEHMIGLARDGRLVYWLDARSGTQADWAKACLGQPYSLAIGDANLIAPPWRREWLGFEAGGRLVVNPPDEIPMRFSGTCTFMVMGKFQQKQPGNLVQGYLVSKRDGSTVSYEFGVVTSGGISNLFWWINGVGSLLPIDFQGAKTLGVVIGAGNRPRFYIDGQFVNVGVTIIPPLTSGSEPLWFGNDVTALRGSVNPLIAMVAINTAMSDADMIDLHTALVGSRWPTKPYTLKRRNPSGLRADWGYMVQPIAVGPGVGVPLFVFQGQVHVNTADVDGEISKVFDSVDPVDPALIAYGAVRGDPVVFAQGEWQWWWDTPPGDVNTHCLFTDNPFVTGYYVSEDRAAGQAYLIRLGPPTVLASAPIGPGFHHYKVTRDVTNRIQAWVDGTQWANVVDATYTQGYIGYFGIAPLGRLVWADRSGNRAFVRMSP